MTGVLLIAIGSEYYKEMSYNMALSLRLAGVKNITLLTDDDGHYYSDKQKKVFNDFITAKESDFIENYMLNPFKLKTLINQYTPYVKTLYLDSDGIFFYTHHDFQ